jgi:hypothetical protein
VWKAVVDGQAMRFRLAGINNQNFIMRDEATGSWWQQVSGEAIQGPWRGRRLEAQPWDEITFEEFRQEHPRGLVLQGEPDLEGEYADENWEDDMQDVPTVTPVESTDALKPRDLVLGIAIDGKARAYPMATLRRDGVVLDNLGGTPLVLVAGENRRSARVFRPEIDGEPIELFAQPGPPPLRLVDAETGSTWDFTGLAIAGPLAGRQLERVQALPDYWFDWKLYHPAGDVFMASAGPAAAREGG